MSKPHTPCEPIDRQFAALIDRLLGLERAPWPSAMPAYHECLSDLATMVEHPCATGWLYRWALDVFRSLLLHRDTDRAECRLDALADVVVSAPGLLAKLRAGLDHARRPNMRSMLRAQILWRAREMYQRRHGRHRSRQVYGAMTDREIGVGVGDVTARMQLHFVVDRLIREGDPAGRALLLVGAGCSVAEAARRTGVSRQSIYRARRRLVEEPGDD